VFDVVFFRLKKCGGVIVNRNGIDFVALANRINNLLAFGDLAENRVPTVQMRCGIMSDEKLGAIGARASICHRENTCFGVLQIGVKLICEFVTWAAATAASRIAALDHEICDHSVKRNAVVVTTLGEVQEIRASHRRFGGIHRGLNIACGGVECDFNIGHVVLRKYGFALYGKTFGTATQLRLAQIDLR
jgi:hypothetical protein